MDKPNSVGVRSDIVLSIDRNEDGERREMYVYYVVAEWRGGFRRAHYRTFDDEPEADALVTKIEAAGLVLDLQHWREIEACYGSDAWQERESDYAASERAADTAFEQDGEHYHGVGGWR